MSQVIGRRMFAGARASILVGVVVIFAAASRPAAAQNGAFGSAVLGSGNFDSAIGLDPSRTYLNAVDVGANPGDGTVTINGVSFTASGLGGNPSGANWGVAAPNVFYPGPGQPNNVTGGLGALLNNFDYGGSGLTVSGLTAGQTYTISFYNRAWDPAGNRRQLITTTSGASSIFDEDIGGTGAGNILRYSFVASGNAETVNFTGLANNATMHMYGFATEQVFTNNWISGTDWTTSSWSGGVPNSAGSNAAFANQNAPASINLNAPVTVGHIQLGGSNAGGWTIGSTGGNTLTLQTDVGGVSVVHTPDAGVTHVISANVNLNNDMAKFGAGTLRVSGAVSGSGGVQANAGTLVLASTANNYSGTTRVAGGTLRLAAPGAAVTIDNAGFETPSMGGGGWSYNTGGAGAWSFVSYSGVAANGSPWVSVAPQGTQAGFVQSSGGSNGLISQTIDAGPNGGVFSLQFQAANRPGYDRTGLSVQVDGTTVATLYDEIGYSNGAFHPVTVNGLMLTPGAHTLSFLGNTPDNNDRATAIDAVTLNQQGGSLPTGTPLVITGGGTLDLNGNTAIVGQVGSIGYGNGVVGNIIGGTLNIGGNNMFFQSGTLTADVTSFAGSQGRLWIGGDSNATVVLGGNNTVYYSDSHSTIIGYGGATGPAGTVKLVSATALGPASQEAQVFAGTLDFNGQTNVTLGTLRLFGADGAKVLNNGATPVLYTGSTRLETGTVQFGGTSNITLGQVTAGGSLQVNGPAQLAISQPSNYGGSTRVAGGTLKLVAAPTATLGARYSFEGNTQDTSGNGINLTPSGGPGYGPGKIGQAIVLTGGQDASVTNTAGVALTGNWTVSGWFNLNASGMTDSFNGIVGTRFGQDQTFDLKVDGPGQRIHGDVGNGGNWINTGLDMGGLTFNANEWHLVTYVVTPTGAQLYFDGVNRANYGWGTDNPAFTTSATSGEMHVGQSYFGEFMQGSIDELSIYASALSGTDVAALYAQGIGNILPVATPLTVNAGATFDMTNFNQTVSSLTGDAGSFVQLGAGTLTVNGSSTTTFGGSLIGSGGLTVAGSGSLTLTALSNYTGTTTINGGTLRTSGAGSIGNGPLVINAAAVVSSTLHIGASQSVASLLSTADPAGAAAINVDPGSTLTVGPGTTRVQGNLTVNGDGASTGTVAITSATTQLTDGSKLTVSGGTLRISATTGGSQQVGTGVTASVAAGGTLELAGSVSALVDGTTNTPAHRVAIANSGIVEVDSGAVQQVGGIDNGVANSVIVPGTLSVDGTLTADHVVQGTLSIGSGGLLTLNASLADGSPTTTLGGSSGSMAGLLVSHSSLAVGHGSVGSVASIGTLGGIAAAPEPSSLLLAAFGVAGAIAYRRLRPSVN